jgi:acetyl esterase/lipase
MINRRNLMIAAATATAGAVAMPYAALAQRSGDRHAAGLNFAASARAGDMMPLWPGGFLGGEGPIGLVLVGKKGAISNIAVPALEIYRPARPNGAAVLVAGGGGYKRIEMDAEACPAAQWLSAHGITAYVLRYRLPGEGWRAGPMAPLQDAQRALRLIAATAGHYGIDPARIGVLGFSAGGHLLGLAASRSGFASYQPVDETDGFDARPAQAALIYPVVTLEPPYDHTSTRIELIGNHPGPRASADWSVETHVRDRCPPMFLVQAQDDPISNIANTALLEQACRAADVPVERHVLPSGGHGFGMGQPGTPTVQWPGWYEAWLSRHQA